MNGGQKTLMLANDNSLMLKVMEFVSMWAWPVENVGFSLSFKQNKKHTNQSESQWFDCHVARIVLAAFSD